MAKANRPPLLDGEAHRAAFNDKACGKWNSPDQRLQNRVTYRSMKRVSLWRRSAGGRERKTYPVSFMFRAGLAQRVLLLPFLAIKFHRGPS
jgi:hypothetical protein